MSAFPIRKIPFLPLGGWYEQDDVDAATRVIRAAADPGGGFFPLPEENDFQTAFAAHEGATKAIAVNSCGSALDLCMMSLGIGQDDEVITTPLTFIATATCAIARGAKVVFADIDDATLCLNPVDVRRRITPRTKAIIPVHFAGMAADIDAFDSISQETGIPIIYDAAHAVSAKYKGASVGGRGKGNCYSFQSNKNMTTLGEGGAITTNDEGFAEVLRQKKTFGYVYGPRLRIVSLGFNYRMTKPQCAVGLTQLAKVDRVISERLRAFQSLHALLDGVEEIIRPPGIGPGHACHLYVARLNTDVVKFSLAMFLQILKDDYGVACASHYPALWTWDLLTDLGYNEQEAACPTASKVCAQVFSLPVFPSTTDEDTEYIAWALKQSLVQASHSI
ncbi:MAG TPA: DegT/DnrJ/EryC1/StrS family aminotransferase [Candidatus Dormibacteraeota bacterium]|nr:DegT/DnrJ/EryC1/StrS family aminotransferase [Candidatus Dormibacteraeota bacterium]